MPDVTIPEDHLKEDAKEFDRLLELQDEEEDIVRELVQDDKELKGFYIGQTREALHDGWVFKARYYLVRAPQGGRKVYLVTGHYAQRDRSSIINEYTLGSFSLFKLGDGSLRDYQPTVTEAQALQWLRYNNPFGVAIPLE